MHLKKIHCECKNINTTLAIYVHIITYVQSTMHTFLVHICDGDTFP